jgi:DNA-binding response OmpR family regulator
MKVLITLTDVEPAVRLKNLLERSGVETEVVSPYDDMRSAVEKQRPDVIVLTGGLVDQPNVQLVKRQLWDGAAVVGLSDLDDPTLRDRLRELGFVEIWTKPVDVQEVYDGIRRILERRRLASPRRSNRSHR